MTAAFEENMLQKQMIHYVGLKSIVPVNHSVEMMAV